VAGLHLDPQGSLQCSYRTESRIKGAGLEAPEKKRRREQNQGGWKKGGREKEGTGQVRVMGKGTGRKRNITPIA